MVASLTVDTEVPVSILTIVEEDWKSKTGAKKLALRTSH